MNCWIISTLFIHWESQIVLLHSFCFIPDSQLHLGMNNRCELWVFGILYFLNLTKLFLTRKFDEIPRVISRQRSHGALTRYSVWDKGLLRLEPGCGNHDPRIFHNHGEGTYYTRAFWWKCILALSHLRIYWDTVLNRPAKILRDRNWWFG